MPETHNPNLQAQRAGGGDIRLVLAFTMLAFLLIFGNQYFGKLKSGPPAPIIQIQPQNREAKKSGTGQSDEQQSTAARAQHPADSPAIVEVLDRKTADQLLKPQVQFGWLTFIAKPLYLALRFLHDHGIRNWGWAIISFTVIFNLLMLWPRIMSMNSSLKMMRVQPKVDALKKRYAHLKINDSKRAEMNAEMMALYRAEGANMYGGCLPMLLQMPLFFAYIRVLQNAGELHHAHWFWLTDLSLPDPLHILPILIIGSMFLTRYITPTPGMDSAQRRMLAIAMPLVMGFTLWRYASGLALYWTTCNLINLMVQLMINRSKIGKEMHAIAAKRLPKPERLQ